MYVHVHTELVFTRLVALPCIPGFELSQLSCPGSSVGRMRSDMGSNPTQAGFSLKKQEAVLSILCLPVMYMYIPIFMYIVIVHDLLCLPTTLSVLH